MDTKIVKSTSKGQITLPKTWRQQFKTDDFSLEISETAIVIKPIRIEKSKGETVIFDADLDNDGKGISVDEMIKMLKKS